MGKKVKPVKVGVIGCGTICQRTYMPNMMNKFTVIDVVGVADLIPERAQKMADQYGVKVMTNEEMYNDPEIEVICNLTYPESHFEVSSEAMKHGKSVYCEKMMACDWEEATELMRLAKENNVWFTTAPDTFLGAWEQSARFYVDSGIIGRPVSIHAQHTCQYRPSNPNFDLTPDSFFFPLHRGGGLPFDWGGYYLHTMLNILGPVKRVTGFAGNYEPVMEYTHPRHPKYGEEFFIDTPTSIFGALEFECGAHGTFHLTSESYNTEAFVMTGTKGTLELGNPNNFDGTLTLIRANAHVKPMQFPGAGAPGGNGAPVVASQLGEFARPERTELPMLFGYNDSSRGVGLADMCYAMRNGRKPRAHCDIGYHAMEVIHGMITSAETGKIYEMTSHFERPEPLPLTNLVGTGQEDSLNN